MNRNNQAGQMKAPGFWYTFLHTIKASFLSRDTILIFAGAIAFYLIFYAWPYGNQQIQHVPSAVLDLDRSAAARRLVTAMDASPAISVVRITQDEGEAMEAFRREEFSVLITIPKNFEKSLTRGENVTVHVLGNGAFPVKARAVQAALGGVVTDKTKLLDDAAVYATGLPGTSVHSHHQAAPGLRVQYMYNEIGGYGNYTVPVVGPVIIQAVMLMAITMALGGLWHGAAIRFVLWGSPQGASPLWRPRSTVRSTGARPSGSPSRSSPSSGSSTCRGSTSGGTSTAPCAASPRRWAPACSSRPRSPPSAWQSRSFWARTVGRARPS